MCSILDQGKFGYEWEEIVMSMCSMKCNKNIASVVRRLVLAACVYHIWSERNKRLFYDKQVRFKMAGLQVKQSNQVKDMADKWKVKMNMKTDDDQLMDNMEV